MAPKLSKINLWFAHFTNENCSTTFMNRTESARAAKYKTTNEDSLKAIGYQNFTKLSDKITKWMDETGLSENTLKIKMLNLLEAKETKFQKIKGAIKDEDLPHGASRIITSGVIEMDPKGTQCFGDGETMIAITTEAIETQRKTLDMAFKIRGTYAPEKHEVKTWVQDLTDEELDSQIDALAEEGDGE